MGGVDGGIEVDGDALDPPLQPALMLGDDGVGQHLPHLDHLPQADRVLEAREGGLRPQRGAGEGIPLEQKFVDGVLSQPRGVVAVGVPARDAEDALPHQLDQLVLDLGRLASVDQARGQPLGQLQPLVDRLE